MISGAHHLAIKVRNLAACERFYTQVLGLSVGRRWPSDGGGGDRSVWLDLGDGAGTFLALEAVAGDEAPDAIARFEKGRPDSDPGLHLLALRIRSDERTTWEQRLASAGVAIVHRTAYTIYFHDPEGNRLGLSHHPDPHPDPRPLSPAPRG